MHRVLQGSSNNGLILQHFFLKPTQDEPICRQSGVMPSSSVGNTHPHISAVPLTAFLELSAGLALGLDKIQRINASISHRFHRPIFLC